MILPAFTAGASLDEPKTNRTLGPRPDQTRGRAIIPQQDCPLRLRTTKAKCFGVSLWCRDYCGPWEDGGRAIGMWYPCGICFGFSW